MDQFASSTSAWSAATQGSNLREPRLPTRECSTDREIVFRFVNAVGSFPVILVAWVPRFRTRYRTLPLRESLCRILCRMSSPPIPRLQKRS